VVLFREPLQSSLLIPGLLLSVFVLPTVPLSLGSIPKTLLEPHGPTKVFWIPASLFPSEMTT